VSKYLIIAIVTIGTVCLNGCSLFRSPSIGQLVDTWETTNSTFKIRVNKYTEKNGGFNPGAYYVFQAAKKDQADWVDIMVFRHDDPVDIPRDQVRFINDQIGYVFMGWLYAVTTDGGGTWFVWDAEKELRGQLRANYALISDVRIETDGTGTMILNPITQQQNRVELRTKDYGQHWM
jgi:hypothetical protein